MVLKMNIKRKLATIRTIKKIQSIEGADNIELAFIDGWQCVINKRDNIQENDLVIYCEIDSIMPEREEFEFLRKNKFKVKTIRLRGQISQGIVFPISLLQKFLKPDEYMNIVDGSDVTEVLGVTKYEPPMNIRFPGGGGFFPRGNFPAKMIKSDEERIQNLVNEIKQYASLNIPFVVSEKLDGTSETCAILNDGFHVCSRNLDLKEYDEQYFKEGDEVRVIENIERKRNFYWKTAIDLNIENKMREYCNAHGINELAIQGELIGEGIQKNLYKIKGHTIKFFTVFNIDEQRYFTHNEMVAFFREIGLEMVPIIDENFHLLDSSIEELIDLADGPSILNINQAREGLVFRSREYIPKAPFGKISFKVISNKFLLKHEG